VGKDGLRVLAPADMEGNILEFEHNGTLRKTVCRRKVKAGPERCAARCSKCGTACRDAMHEHRLADPVIVR
jgi:hypothetical protein